MDVIVVGAGIAGLSAGIALRRAGHRVTIYERSSFANEIGAAIHVPPNSNRFLTAWGLDMESLRFVKSRGVVMLDPFTTELRAQVAHEDGARECGGADLYFAHRVDLHNALKGLATQEAGLGQPVNIKTRSPVSQYDPVIPSITLGSGETIQGDLVIAADGIHSAACTTVLGGPNKPEPAEHMNSCFRFLVDSEALEEDPMTKDLNKDYDAMVRVYFDNPGSRRIVNYPCRDSTVQNFVGLHYDEGLSTDSGEDWHATVDKDVVLEKFSGFHPSLLRCIEKASEIKRWPLLYRHPLPHWRRGHLVLAGDAAHPMLPHQGQGGAQAVEDGAAIGLVLCGIKSKSELADRLDIYDRIRRRRASVMQIISNVGQDQMHLVRDELLKHIPENEIPVTPRDQHDFAFGFDVIRTVITAMKKYDSNYQLPKGFFETEVAGVPGKDNFSCTSTV